MMLLSLETRAQPVLFFSNSSWYSTVPDLAGITVGMETGAQAEMKRSKKKKVRSFIERNFIRNTIAQSATQSKCASTSQSAPQIVPLRTAVPRNDRLPYGKNSSRSAFA